MKLRDEVLAFIERPAPAEFAPLALEVFRNQFANVPAYRSYCLGRRATPATIRKVDDIPAVSTVAFKHAAIRNTEAGAPPGSLTFMTSGTTQGLHERGRHVVPYPEVYRASALAHLGRMLFPDGQPLPTLALHPTADRMPTSSLSWMITWCLEGFGRAPTLCAATPDGVDVTVAIEFLRAREQAGEAACILTTTAAVAALFTAMRARDLTLRLPAGSRLMDTGGAKGQAVPLTPVAMVAAAAAMLGLAPACVINEYGMTELCSQLYDATPFNSAFPATGARLKLPPPWMRPAALDPVTLAPLADDQVGLLAFIDLANVGSIAAVMTEDFGFVHDGAVAILGRAASGGARGCALGLEEFARVEQSRQDPRP